MTTPRRPARFYLFAACLGAATLLAACGTNSTPGRISVYQSERFQSDQTFSRLFDGTVAETCEAARRALLSQGYVIANATEGAVRGSKHFQPEGEVHIEIGFNVVCVPEGKNGELATAFVSAQQDRYALKKSPNATSIGVSAIGSISVPLSSTQDSLVKVASETIPAGTFYDRFFGLMHRLLKEQAAEKVEK